jgi:hypothetical protein
MPIMLTIKTSSTSDTMASTMSSITNTMLTQYRPRRLPSSPNIQQRAGEQQQ